MSRNRLIDEARKILGLSAVDGAEEAKKRYRELAKIWHPDVNTDLEANARMQDINRAFGTLMKEEFGILDFWEDYNRWWWRQYGNDPLWGNYYPDDETNRPARGRRRLKAGREDTGKGRS
ncbi:MAG TPA: J domain-containing protein [Smithellaceae bacterium]|nr:J domain-containing protein [Smithellaceae bacterium]HQF83483.1 J domain-containing protein [Smithellaceae bacterium]HQG79672.1 J domain-containing protein [Smithellaceae bacterium]